MTTRATGRASRPRHPVRRAGLLVAALPLAAGLNAGLGGTARAQSAGGVEQAVAGQTTILQRFTPPPKVGTVDLAVQHQRKRVPEDRAEQIRFTLRSVRLDGGDTVPLADIEPIWQYRIGQQISLADLYRMAEAVDAAYVRAGYFSLTVVPVQDYATGHVSLRVYEGYVETVEIVSDIPGIEQRLEPYIRRITAMRPIRIAEAERVLLLMADLGGLAIDGLFIPPDRPSGGGKLRLEVGFTRQTGAVVFDNLGTSDVGPLELSASYAVNDLLGLYETTSLVAVTVPNSPDELALLQIGQDFPIGHDGLSAGYTFTHVTTRPSGEYRHDDIKIETVIGTAYLRYPLLRSQEQSLFASFEVNLRNDDIDAMGTRVDRSRARWATAELSYDRQLDKGAIEVSGSLNQGLGVDVSRPGVPSDFRFGRVDLDYGRPLGADFGLRIRAVGQYAPGPLPAATQVSLGGDPYGWAFDGGALAGDSGAATAIELSRDFETGLDALPMLTLTGFADYGVVWNNDVTPDQERGTLGSVGLGVSFMLAERAHVQLVAATPWDVEAGMDDPGTRVFFQVAVPF